MRKEIDYWFEQAKADLKSATDLLKTENFYASVFFSQQTSEKALKSLYIKEKRTSVKTHNLVFLARELDAPKNIINDCAELTPEDGKGGASMGGNEAFAEIEKFVKRVEEVIRVEKVIIFGSRAREDYLADSDVDLIIVSRDFEGVPFYERMDKLILLWESPLDLDVLCYTPDEFKMKKEEICIVKQAVEEGVVIAG